MLTADLHTTSTIYPDSLAARANARNHAPTISLPFSLPNLPNHIYAVLPAFSVALADLLG